MTIFIITCLIFAFMALAGLYQVEQADANKAMATKLDKYAPVDSFPRILK